MPWNDQRGGKGGWGEHPPSLDEILQNLRKFFKGGSFMIWIFVLIILGFWLVSCVYTVGVNEVGMIQRFGRYVIPPRSPGLHFKLPRGIEKVTKVKVDYVYTEEFGLRTVKAGKRTEYAPSRAFLGESLMLTGDLNGAVVPWIVQFRISEPDKYLFKVKNVRETLRDLSEAIMRQVVGDRSISEVINKRKEIADMARVDLQKALDEAETGLSVKNIELKRTNVPELVQPSFNEVNRAGQEKEQMIYKAKEDYNKAIPTARGDAEKMIRGAEGYALDRVNRAKGNTNRFLAVLEEYEKAKDVTRRRLYLEAIQEILPKIKTKYILDHEQKNLLPLLNLQPRVVQP